MLRWAQVTCPLLREARRRVGSSLNTNSSAENLRKKSSQAGSITGIPPVPFRKSRTAEQRVPLASQDSEQNRDGLLTFRMKPVKSVVLSGSDFPRVSGEIVEEKSLARRGKTNIVHAPPRLAE
jgi:hypothetical protein